MTFDALEATARELLSEAAYAYFRGGAEAELTLRDNKKGWSRVRLLPRVLRDVSSVSTSVEVLGTEAATPVWVAPMGYQKLGHDEGELATARGTAGAGSVMAVSTFSTSSIEDVAISPPGSPRWFQLYVHPDRDLTATFVRRASGAGYRAVVVTVDLPVLGTRHDFDRQLLELPDGVDPANMRLQPGDPRGTHAETLVDPALTFDDIGWVKWLSDLPVVVKGVVRADDALAAIGAGADAVIVSNHGGRQLDGCVSSADALPGVVAAVARRVPVLVDGGIRTGGDVVKALCLGASAVFVGRPVLWGLTVGGAAGVQRVIEQLTTETATSMALCGATSVSGLDRSLIA